MNTRRHYLALVLAAAANLALLGVCWWLGWIGTRPSIIGFGVLGGTLVLMALEYWSYHLAHNGYEWQPAIPATIAGASAMAFAAWLAPSIGWATAIATVAVMFVWGITMLPAFVIVRNAVRNNP